MTQQLSLPDFDDMLDLADKISEYQLEKDRLEIKIKTAEESIYRVATKDTKYYINGKPPATSFVKETYSYSGFDGGILALRHEYAEVCAKLSGAQKRFEVMKMMVDLYRTESANKRATL